LHFHPFRYRNLREFSHLNVRTPAVYIFRLVWLVFFLATVTAFGSDPLPFRDLLVPVDPQDAITADASMGKWRDCLDKIRDYQPVRASNDGQLLPECQPDTLYTWGG